MLLSYKKYRFILYIFLHKICFINNEKVERNQQHTRIKSINKISGRDEVYLLYTRLRSFPNLRWKKQTEIISLSAKSKQPQVEQIQWQK